MASKTAESASYALAVSIAKSADIATFFKQKTGLEFIDWFNINCANQHAWVGKALGNSPEVKLRFNLIWDQLPVMFATKKINLVQFIALTSIFINEVGAELLPITEKVGRQGHPALAYPFDTIKGIKVSYNTPPNKTAFELFNNALFIDAHGHLPQAGILKNTADKRWHSVVYPQGDFPTSTDVAMSGFIREADFYKFRGRGLIQTTWRSNYVLLIKFIQAYNGSNATVKRYKKKWGQRHPDEIATISTNEDWDDLFQNSDLVIPCASVKCHNQASGGYLSLSSNLDVIIKTGKGSIFNMGLKISGSTTYATLFRNRVIQIMLTLSNQVKGDT